MRIVVITLGLLLASGTLVARQATPEYELLDNTPATFTNLNVETIRGAVVREKSTFPYFRLYALNTHGSTLNLYQSMAETPDRIWNLPLYPVSMAWYDDDPNDPADDRLLVVCQGSHVLVSVDPKPNFNEGIYDLVQLPSEPADIVVDETTKKAYVSCMGSDQLVEVDLTTMQAAPPIDLDVKRPCFLHLDQGKVYIAPMMSGNNSAVVETSPGYDVVLDLDGRPGADQRDYDLLALDPATGVVEEVLRGMGTLLFDHGRNPVTGKYWMLNIDALNKDPAKQSEPAINGDFAVNQLSIATLPAGGSTASFDAKFDLDDLDADPSAAPRVYDAARAAAAPWGMTFTPSGNAWIAASTADNVVAVNGTTGARIAEVALPDGAIPRQIVLSPYYATPALRVIFVYAWGLNQVIAYYVGTGFGGYSYGDVYQVFNLGLDPTPPDVAEGRRIFYDASFSKDGRFTCATCHTGGMTDGIAWNLSGLPKDNKGPMVTQTLRGLEELFPYHWRGERSLAEFNPAFTELLGGARELTPSEFADFERFIFSLRVPANPKQDVHRRLVDLGAADEMPNGEEGSATQGQQDYLHAVTNVGDMLSCVDCHALPTGSSNDIIAENLSGFPARTNFEITALFNGNLPFKQFSRDVNDFTPAVQVPAPGGGTQNLLANPLGVGVLHEGREPTLFDFVDNGFGLPGPEVANIVAFLEQFDTGLSAAAHRAFLMDASNANAMKMTIEDVLVPQAEKTIPWIDLVAVPANHSGARWLYYQSGAGYRFRPDTSSAAVPDRTLSDFVSDVLGGGPDYIFLGLPPGNGRRFAIDFDHDGLLNAEDRALSSAPYSEFNPDLDEDGWLDGYELFHGSDPLNHASEPNDAAPPVVVSGPDLLWETNRNAKITFRTNEPTTARIEFTSAAEGTRVIQRDVPDVIHTVVLQDLLQSTDNPGMTIQHAYSVQVIVTDLSDNTAAPVPLAQLIETTTGCIGEANRIGEFEFVSLGKSPSAGVAFVQAAIRVDGVDGKPNANPAADRAVFCQLFVRRAGTTDFEVYEDIDDISAPVRPLGFSQRFFGVDVAYALEDGDLATTPVDPSCVADPAGPNCDIDPILISDVSAADGMVDINVRVKNLNPGDEVALRVLGVLEIDPLDTARNLWPGMAAFTGLAFISVPIPNPPPPVLPSPLRPYAIYSLPDTPTELREIGFTF